METPGNRQELMQQMNQLTLLIQTTRFFNVLIDGIFTFAHLFLLTFIVYRVIGAEPFPLPTHPKFSLYISFILLSVLGVFLSIIWISANIRFQMFLRLRYFQFRSLERLMGNTVVSIFGDENKYFARPSQEISSIDGVEKITNNISGVVGQLKTFPWAWVLPMIFFAFYMYILITLCIHCAF